MKKVLIAAIVLGGFTLLAAEKPVTIEGEGKCAKCALKEKKDCQNAVVVEKDKKKTTYYLVNNDVSKAFHKNLCTASAKVKVTGTDKLVDEKHEFTATKIELAKEK